VDTPSLTLPAQEVRRDDPDRFITALFAPAERRDDLFALYAFNGEIARIRDIVSEPMLGQIRLQWWRERLDNIYADTGEVPRHPVAEALADAVRRHDLPRRDMEALINARERDLDEAPVPDRAALNSYVADTGGALARLAVRILHNAPDPALMEAADHTGRAWALAGLLRAAPAHAGRGKVFLPAAELAAKGADAQDLARGHTTDALRGVIRDLAEEAGAHVRRARSLQPRPGRAAVAAFLPAVLTEGFLARLRRVRHDPCHPRLALPQRRPLRLLLMAWAGRY